MCPEERTRLRHRRPGERRGSSRWPLWVGLSAASACLPWHVPPQPPVARSGPSEWSIVRDAHATRPCIRPVGRVHLAPGEPLVLAEAPVACDVVAVPVVTLDASRDGSRPDPGHEVVMTRDGRYYTTAARGRQVLEWSPEGRYLRAVGREGEGPGEFSPRGSLHLFLDAGDSLYVLDGAQRWTVFDQSLAYRRTFQGRFHGRHPATVHVVAGQGILTTADLPGASAPWPMSFHWMSLEGAPARSFGVREEGGGGFQRDRPSALDGEGGFWVASPNGGPGGMILERWTLSGERVRILEQRGGWLPGEPDPGMGERTEPPFLEYDLLHVDGEGLLWVGAATRDPNGPKARGADGPAPGKGPYDTRIDVIDPRAGVVLASFRYSGADHALPPFTRFVGPGRRSYRVVGSFGSRSLEIYDVQLVAP